MEVTNISHLPSTRGAPWWDILVPCNWMFSVAISRVVHPSVFFFDLQWYEMRTIELLQFHQQLYDIRDIHFCSALSLDEDFERSLYANRNSFEAFATRKPQNPR